MFSTRSLVRAVVFLLTLTCARNLPAQSTVFDSQFNGSQSTFTSASVSGILNGQRFTVSGPDNILTGVSLYNINALAPMDLTAQVWTDSGGLPGSFITDFGSTSGVSGGAATASFTGSATLDTGTSYWLVLRADAGFGLFQGVTGGAVGAGPWLGANDRAAYQNASPWQLWNPDYPPSPTLEMTMSATSAVPEPSTYAAFAGIAALGLVAWRRRRAEPIGLT